MTRHSFAHNTVTRSCKVSTHLKLSSLKSLAGVFALLVLISSSASGQAPPGVTSLKINSAVLGEERTILVRVPPGYETNKLRYPVLYMTDGNAHIGHTSSTVEFLARNGRMSELIVVGITNTDRTRDLSPTHVTTTVAGGNSALQFPTSGGADKFLKFIETELSLKSKSVTAYFRIGSSRAIRWAVCSRFTRWSRGLSCSILTWRSVQRCSGIIRWWSSAPRISSRPEKSGRPRYSCPWAMSRGRLKMGSIS